MNTSLLRQRFGRWTVIWPADMIRGASGRPYHRWVCRCDCGIARIVRQDQLVSGKSKSCGHHAFHRREGVTVRPSVILDRYVTLALWQAIAAGDV